MRCGGLPSKIWQKFYHEKIGKLDIAWRESKYAIRKVKKINVNDLCSCGSGKKLKSVVEERGYMISSCMYAFSIFQPPRIRGGY